MHYSYGFIFLILIFSSISSNSWAHKSKPAIIDIIFYNNAQVSLTIQTNIESILAKISPIHKEINQAPEVAYYKQLRSLPAEKLEQKFKRFESNYQQALHLSISKQALEKQIVKWELDKIIIPEVGDTRLSRQSTISYKAKVRYPANSATWQYAQQYGDNVVRFLRQGDQKRTSFWLTNGKSSPEFNLNGLIAETSLFETIKRYISLGFEHILPKGLDHILFVLALFLLNSQLSTLLWQVTAFTLAHSITLGLSSYGIVSLSPLLVEPLIAASIIYIGIENLVVKSLKPGRIMVVFVFGLLHGFGFATMLLNLGLPDADFFMALMSFNIGVELGQISVLLMAYLIVKYIQLKPVHYRTYVVIPCSLIISTIALFWFVQRIQPLSLSTVF
jgi:hydrogenase/urease accessory protein HupE